MAAQKYPLVVEQGATFALSMQLSTGGPVSEGGTPINLTGAEVRMQIRQRVTSTSTLVTLTSTGASQGATGIYIDDAAQGQFTITMTADDTEAYTWRSGVYDLEVEYSGGVVKRYLYGSVKLSKEVTR